MTHEGHDHPPTTAGTRPRKQEQEDATTDITEVAHGVLRTQLPINIPGLGHVNCYVLEDERGIAVVDPGLPGPDSYDHLVDRLARAGYEPTDVHTVVVTHSHPDHFGGAFRLQAEAGARIVSHESFRTTFDQEADASEDSSELELNSAEARAEAIERYLKRPSPWGGARPAPPPEFFERLRLGEDLDETRYASLKPTDPLIDGQVIRLARREWVAMHTPGHTHDHLCLFDPEFGVMLTGDHVLPTITPHISGLASSSDPLALFFDSLGRMVDVDDVSIALPAHGHPFTDLGGRAEHIIEHHNDRLDIIRNARDDLPTGTVVDFMKVLFQERSWGSMAESETYAHLEHLRELGELTRSDDDGMARYAAIG